MLATPRHESLRSQKFKPHPISQMNQTGQSREDYHIPLVSRQSQENQLPHANR
jgi:hypothetical protein